MVVVVAAVIKSQQSWVDTTRDRGGGNDFVAHDSGSRVAPLDSDVVFVASVVVGDEEKRRGVEIVSIPI